MFVLDDAAHSKIADLAVCSVTFNVVMPKQSSIFLKYVLIPYRKYM